MRWNWKNSEAEQAKLNSCALMLVAFPELEGTPFSEWWRETLSFILAPVRRVIEILILDTTEVIRGIFGGYR